MLTPFANPLQFATATIHIGRLRQLSELVSLMEQCPSGQQTVTRSLAPPAEPTYCTWAV